MKTSGVVGGLGLRVRLTRDGNKYIKAGTIGILEPHELSVDGVVLSARFYPCALTEKPSGFGLVTLPEFESLGYGENK